MSMLIPATAATPAPQGFTGGDIRRPRQSPEPRRFREHPSHVRLRVALLPSLGRGPRCADYTEAYHSHLAEKRQLSVATVRLHNAALATIHRFTSHQGSIYNREARRLLPGITRTPGRPQCQAISPTAENLAVAKTTSRLPNRHHGRGEKGAAAERWCTLPHCYSSRNVLYADGRTLRS